MSLTSQVFLIGARTVFFRVWIKSWDQTPAAVQFRESLFQINIDAMFILTHPRAFIIITHPFSLPIQSEWFIEMHILLAIDYIRNLLKAFCFVPVMSAGLQKALNLKTLWGRS